MLRYHNRILLLEDDRLPKKIYYFDLATKKNAWIDEIRDIAKTLHLPGPEHAVLYDLDVVQQAILRYSQNQWWEELDSKPKLRTYQTFKERDDGNVVVKANLPRYQRSIISRFMCGILPLEIEVGRYTNVKEEDRLCKTCNGGFVENEYHFLYKCKALKPVRKAFYREYIGEVKAFKKLPDAIKTKLLLYDGSVRVFTDWIIEMLNARRNIMYRPTK